jgi:branched-chain amino acid transport system permease protein
LSETINYINQILAFVIFGAATNLVMGYAGVYATGPAAFGAMTGYAVVYLTAAVGMPFVVALLCGIVLAVILGLLVGVVMLRLDQLWIILLTLAVQLVVVGVATGLTPLGGAYGIEVTKSLDLFGATLFTPQSVLPFAVVLTLIAFGIAWRLGQSPYGRVLKGMRDDVLASRSLGKDVYFNRLSIFVITCGMAGLAGGLLTTITQSATPDSFGFSQSVQIIAIVVIGGLGNLVGTVIGAIIVVLLTPFFIEVVRLNSNIASLAQLVAFGVVLTLFVLFRPAGIVPEGAFLRRHLRRSNLAPEVTANEIDGAVEPIVAPSLQEPPSRSSTTEQRESAPAERLESVQDGEASGPDHARTGETVLDVRNVSKSFAGVQAVDGLSLHLERGRISALIGPNGAGKTTVFNLLTGVLPLDQGSVILNGRDITGLRPDQIAHAGMVRTFQDVRIFGGMSVLENVMFGVLHQPGEHLGPLFLRPQLVRKGERRVRDRAFECLDFVGMADAANVRCSSLGYGQQKLVSLARLLATDAEVLLLDEPMSGIDHHALDEILQLVLRLRDVGRTVCVVEHSLDVVRQLADHIFFMELGKITAEGSFEELTSDPRLSQVYFGVGA